MVVIFILLFRIYFFFQFTNHIFLSLYSKILKLRFTEELPFTPFFNMHIIFTLLHSALPNSIPIPIPLTDISAINISEFINICFVSTSIDYIPSIFRILLTFLNLGNFLSPNFLSVFFYIKHLCQLHFLIKLSTSFSVFKII